MATRKYSQLKATLAIAKASLKASFRNPSTVVFGLLFPLIFIMVFGFIGGNGGDIDVHLASGSNTENPIYQSLQGIEQVKFTEELSDEAAIEKLEKGEIDAMVNIIYHSRLAAQPVYTVELKTSEASPQNGGLFLSLVKGISNEITLNQFQLSNQFIAVDSQVVSGREYKSIDFILPGQLGFALLSTGVFATAFVFIILKETLVIKRFFATPISRNSVLIGEALSRLVFSMFQATIILLVGRFFFDFTLINGVITFINMLILSGLGLTVFMGFGFVVSSVAKNQDAVPPISNLFTLPQFLLAGTFFPVEAFPGWLQPVSKALPLTYLNDAMRKVAFEGASLIDVRFDIAILFIWMVVIYAIAIRAFKWDN